MWSIHTVLDYHPYNITLQYNTLFFSFIKKHILQYLMRCKIQAALVMCNEAKCHLSHVRTIMVQINLGGYNLSKACRYRNTSREGHGQKLRAEKAMVRNWILKFIRAFPVCRALRTIVPSYESNSWQTELYLITYVSGLDRTDHSP